MEGNHIASKGINNNIKKINKNLDFLKLLLFFSIDITDEKLLELCIQAIWSYDLIHIPFDSAPINVDIALTLTRM